MESNRGCMARMLAAAVMLCMILTLFSGCASVVKKGADNKPESGEKSLYEHGLDVIGAMQQLVPYTDIFSSSPDIKEIAGSAANGDYTEPSAVYKITVGDIGSIMDEIFETIGTLPESVAESIKPRMLSGMASQVNAEGGSAAIAAASVCTASKLFVSAELTEDMQYIYVFENAPAAAVSFVGGEDNAVYATGMFLFYAEFTDQTSGALDEDAFYRFWEMLGMKVEKIK